MAVTALLADIRRLTVHDGPGIRDTVFLKGCPLHCLWCHNPESISPARQLLFRRNLCVNCGECVSRCPVGAHSIRGMVHSLDRKLCRNCGGCADGCLYGALSMCGREVTPETVLAEVLKDRDFFVRSGGGVTLSGGEPLLYPEFTAETFRLLRREGIHTALDTSGMVNFSAFERVLPRTSLILFDIKGMNPARHLADTGADNSRILENLGRLGRMEVPVEIRMPVVPGHNDDRAGMIAAGRFLAGLPAVKRIRLLAFHAMARDKYRMCGMRDTMPEVAPPSAEEMAAYAEILGETSGKPVVY